MAFKLLSNDLLLRLVQPTQTRGIQLPPQALDFQNNGMIHTFKLVARGPGKLNKHGVRVPFEANVGDNLVVFPITHGPHDVGNGLFILKSPEQSVLAVIPLQRSKVESGLAPVSEQAPAGVANTQTLQCEQPTPQLYPA